MRRRAAKVIAGIIVVAGASAWMRAAGLAHIDRMVHVDSPDRQRSIVVGVRQAPGSWKTFESTKWGIALEYPASWSVDDDGEEVVFRSEEGLTIVLGLAATDNPSEPPPGRRTPTPQCSITTTPHGVAATVCIEPTSLARRAVLLLKRRDGRQFRLALSTRGRNSPIFDAMMASVRPHP